jgi:hypothetical protein
MIFEKDLFKFIPEDKKVELISDERFDLDEDAIEVEDGYIIPVNTLNELENKNFHVPTLKDIVRYGHEFILEFGDEKNPNNGLDDEAYTESLEQYISDRTLGRVRNVDDFVELYNLN